jgi:preprotein translocase subunit SecF
MATDTTEIVSHHEAVELSRAVHTGSFFSRLSTGTGAFDILGRRRYYYMFSTFLLVTSILLIFLKGFHLGTDFAGGSTLTFTPDSGSTASTSGVTQVLTTALGSGQVQAVQTLGGSTIQATLVSLSEAQVATGKEALTKAFSLAAGSVSGSDVSSSWGAQISDRAVLAVIIFLIAVGLFIWIRYEKRVAVGAVLSVLHDVVVTAGVYSLAGFEVTPATVIGLLTILGFSLYDTVVVYDKVQENAKGLTSLLRRTYPETANLAVNQTLMRSLNTSLIALLPVAGLLVAGVAVLGGGTLKDLALVLLVGMLIGAYSSIFVAVPIAVDLKMREPTIINHTARVLAKRKSDGLVVDPDGDPVGIKGAGPHVARASAPVNPLAAGLTPSAPPKPGVKPQRPGRPVARAPMVKAPVRATATTNTAPAVPSGTALEDPPSVVTAEAVAHLANEAVNAPAPARKPGQSGKAARPTGKRGR